MEIIRFALGFRFAPMNMNSIDDEDAQVLSRILSEVPKKRLAGMQLHAGHCALDENDDPRIFTVVTMGQGIKRTKALYYSVMRSAALTGMLALHRPIILTNVIARLEGLKFCGEFDKKGELQPPVQETLRSDDRLDPQ